MIGCAHSVLSQQQQIELQISNDKFVLLDRYYTSGLHVTYRKTLNKGFLFQAQEEDRFQLNISIGNETYTPKNLTSFDKNDLDRPYAGWLFGKVELGKLKEKSAFFVALESGITGEEALSGKLQIALHEFLNIDSRPTWVDEIAYKWLFNVKMLQLNEFITGTKTSFINQFSASLGSKDTYIGNDIFYFFGKQNKLNNSVRINALVRDGSKEFFGFVSGGYRYVVLNTLIQGSPFNSNDPFTTHAEQSVFRASAGMVLKTKKSIYKLVYHANSKETPSSQSHVYGAFTIGFNL